MSMLSPFTRQEENDLRRSVKTRSDTWNTTQLNRPNVRKVLVTAGNRDSHKFLVLRELPNIREFFESTGIWVRSHTGYSQTYRTPGRIWVWPLIWGWKTYRKSGRFLDRANVWVWASFCNWWTSRTSEKFYYWYFSNRYHFLYSFFQSFCWTSWVDTQHWFFCWLQGTQFFCNI